MANPFWQVNPLTENKDGKWYAGCQLLIMGEEKQRTMVYELPFAEETSANVWAAYLQRRTVRAVQTGMLAEMVEKGLIK